MSNHLKILKFDKFFEEYESPIEDFISLEVGDKLIAKNDVYIRRSRGSELNYLTPSILDVYGDRLFVKKGRTKKISKIDYNGIHLSGFSSGLTIHNLYKFFTIKNGEFLSDTHKYNL